MRIKSTTNFLSGVKKPFKITFGVLSIFLVASTIFSIVISAKSHAEAEGEGAKVLSVYDDGQRISFRTDANTVRAALKERGVALNSGDNIEPSLDEELTGNDYNVNIYRARPILVEDGASRERVMTASQTPQKMAGDAGFKLFDEDIIYNNPSENPAVDGVATHLKIKRAKLISVDMFGKKTDFRTQAETIKDFLEEKKISLQKNDEVSVPLETKIKVGDNFRIWRNGKQIITVDEEIEFEVEEIKDADKEISYRQVKELGEKGTKVVSYEIEMQSGEEISRTKINEAETKKPKKQVEIVGTKNVIMPYTGGGSKTEWLRASGIPESEWGYVDFIITKESTWNPNARNGQYYGLYQTNTDNLARYGCSGTLLSDPVCQLQAADKYKSRYGSWADAYNSWRAQGWW
ncbi:DUF348 domain-containing protein [Candidatus Saccharibacteria bacterium]|jgi:uncharacterized protein YabE (DUF348 family)|nr:DUF348 domain-containing protein [Candidatus Saccharibacteria bacterium]NCU43450.1 DUF348 domain-containing protein [Candidatus Saccharibacteria bacterium]